MKIEKEDIISSRFQFIVDDNSRILLLDNKKFIFRVVDVQNINQTLKKVKKLK